jgi:hypothetical protein
MLLQHLQNFPQLKVPEDSASTTPVTSLHHLFSVCTKDNLVISLEHKHVPPHGYLSLN